MAFFLPFRTRASSSSNRSARDSVPVIIVAGLLGGVVTAGSGAVAWITKNFICATSFLSFSSAWASFANRRTRFWVPVIIVAGFLGGVVATYRRAVSRITIHFIGATLYLSFRARASSFGNRFARFSVPLIVVAGFFGGIIAAYCGAVTRITKHFIRAALFLSVGARASSFGKRFARRSIRLIVEAGFLGVIITTHCGAITQVTKIFICVAPFLSDGAGAAPILVLGTEQFAVIPNTHFLRPPIAVYGSQQSCRRSWRLRWNRRRSSVATTVKPGLRCIFAPLAHLAFDPTVSSGNTGVHSRKVLAGTANAPRDDADLYVASSLLAREQRSPRIALTAIHVLRLGAQHILRDQPVVTCLGAIVRGAAAVLAIVLRDDVRLHLHQQVAELVRERVRVPERVAPSHDGHFFVGLGDGRVVVQFDQIDIFRGGVAQKHEHEVVVDR
mmetsp:Transcript_24158/g.51751  ORF Transcript_24158/g.51751 Transcript_24158/m.51751 type:complete len:443 (-) Transcript_24158:702-2030(-)